MGMDMAMRDGLDRGYIDPSPSIKAGSHGAAVEAISTQPVCFVVRSCTLGQVLVAWSPRGVCAVFLGDNETELIESLVIKMSVSDVPFRAAYRKWYSACQLMKTASANE